MAPPTDAIEEPVVGDPTAPSRQVVLGTPLRRRWGRRMSLRTRLLLLVVASVVPLVCYGVFREYLDYTVERKAAFDGLMSIARGTAVAVERDLQLRVSSLETLAMAPALLQSDLKGFDQQAQAYLEHLPAGSLLGIVTPDREIQRLYGLPDLTTDSLPRRTVNAGESQVFDTGKPVITDLYAGHFTRIKGFSVDVPVIRDGRVIFDLFIQLPAPILEDLIARQYLPPHTVLSLIDTAGVVVARVPNADRFVGSPIVPSLWADVQTKAEGIIRAPTLEGVPAAGVYTHIAPFNWAVLVGSPEEAIFAPMRNAIISLTLIGLTALTAGLLLAMVLARGITRPIEQLRWLAQHDVGIQPGGALTGLPEADIVARALVAAAAERQEAAKELAESESRFRAVFERSPSGTILLDPDTLQVIDSNAAAASYVGCKTEELRGRPLTDFVLETSPGRIRAICRSVVNGHSSSYETRIKGRVGVRNLLVAVAPVQVSGRTLVLINQIDVTGLRQAEAGLRVNEERLELALEGANLGIWDWDVVNDALTWSEHQWQLHGLEPRPGVPGPDVWRHAVHPADLARTLAELKAALKSSDQPYTTEYSVVMPDGSIRRLLGRGQTIRDANGRAIRMVGINMDVTARYEAEMARDRLIWMLETERSRLVEILEALPVAVGIVDASGRIILGNAAMKKLNGPVIQSMIATPQGEWIGYGADGGRVAPEDYPIRRALRLGETTLPGIDFLFRAEDGTETWYRVASLPLRREDGMVQEVLGIFQDIDAEKRLLDVQQQINVSLEQRVQEEVAAREAAQHRAAHAERMQALGQIAGGIAHDFNNVLQAVSGGAALIENRPLDVERVLRNARLVMDAAKRGAAITSRLLAFSRRGDLRAESIDAAALLADMADVLSHTLGGSVVCALDVAPGLPPLFADRGQLETVLVNLATNARDAMPLGGTLTFAARAESVVSGTSHPAGPGPGHYVRIVVSDTGNGMDQTVLSRVTEPFFTTKEPGKGTGLGLAMAKGFAEQSGGTLSIDSVVGSGTRINLWLPCATGVPGAMAEQAVFAGSTDPDKECVLLVDDDPIVREVLMLSLDDAGYTVLAADSGSAALSMLESAGRVDVLVSDLTMPEMNGLALIRAVQERRPNMPVVLLTGYAGDGATLAVGGAISGMFSLLRKPVSGTQLVDRIKALMESRKAPSRT